MSPIRLAAVSITLALGVLSSGTVSAQETEVPPAAPSETEPQVEPEPEPAPEPEVEVGPEIEDDIDALDERSPAGPPQELGEPVPPPPDEDHDDGALVLGDIALRAALGEGVTVDAGDAFALQIRARVQFRVSLARAPDGAIAAGADDGTEIEFQIRRLRLLLAGHAFVRELQYYIQLGFSPRDMEPDLLVPVRDAYLTWQFHRDIGVRFGQMKVPFGLQRRTSSSALQFADRSIVTSELNLDRDIGIYLLSDDLAGLGGVLGYQLGVFGGRGRNRFGALDAAMFAGRVMVNPFGSFDNLSEGDHTRSMQPRLALGVSAAYNIDSNRVRSTHENVFRVGRFDFLHLGADVHFKWAGLSVVAETMFREASEPSMMGTIDGEPVTEFSRSAWGWFTQVGYMLPFPLEIVARYGEIRPLDSNAPEANFFLQHELGGGLSYYVQEHALKVQADYFYYFGADPSAELHQVRVQVQLYF